eukprot:403344025
MKNAVFQHKNILKNKFYQGTQRFITLNATLPNDPYFLLGVDKNTKFPEIKKKYFILAKKYHPDLNPGNEYANKMFILIGEAYRQVEIDFNPALREARKKAAEQYETTAETINRNFKSRRPENKTSEDGQDPFEETLNGNDKAYDYAQEKFLRRYRYQHLTNNANLPMSYRNIDRHGLKNLTKESTKILDKYKIPPLVFFGFLTLGFTLIVLLIQQNSELNLQELQRRNLLLAMRKTQQKIEYEDYEVTGTEQITIASKQYENVVTQKHQKEQEKLNSIKSIILSEGSSKSKLEKVDLRQ